MSQQVIIPKPGEWLIGWYPLKNQIDGQREDAPRNLCCLSVRDLHKEPLHLETIERRPLLQRGRYLMFAWDDDIGETRCFYLCQLTATPGDSREEPTLQIVGFDGDNPDAGMERLGPEFAANVFARAVLAEAVRKLRQRGQAELYRVIAEPDEDEGVA